MLRRWLVSSCLVTIATVLPGMRAAADTPGVFTARWQSISAPAVPSALRIGSISYTAGEQYYRVDDQSDVAVYSLSLLTPPDRGATLTAANAVTSSIPHLDQITALVRDSADDTDSGRLNPQRAAAYQIAIWQLTDNVRVATDTVPDTAIRQEVAALLTRSASETAANHHCDDCETVSTAATAAVLTVELGSTVSDEALSVTVSSSGDQFFSKPNYFELRINGLGATVCAGEVDRVRVDRPITHDVLRSSCAYRRSDPDQVNDASTSTLPRVEVDRESSASTGDSAHNTVVIHIPRQQGSQDVSVSWTANTAPGMLFTPTTAAPPVITAATFDDARTQTVTIAPADFASFQGVLQRTFLPFFARHGVLGLILLALLVVILLSAKEGFVRLVGFLWRQVRRVQRAAWQRWRCHRTDVKARKALSRRLARLPLQIQHQHSGSPRSRVSSATDPPPEPAPQPRA